MAALRRLYRLYSSPSSSFHAIVKSQSDETISRHYRKLNLDKSDLPEGLRSVDEAAFMSPEHFFCAQKARIEEG